ncbi:MAG: DNA alkylation repair protein [Candidatus Paceibacterota bacterium]
MESERLIRKLEKLADKEQARILSGFFKTGKGQYGEGDIFLGIKVPISRKIAKEFTDLELGEIQRLLNSKIHEVRFAALVILIEKFDKSSSGEQEKIFKLYLKNIAKNINNWDLVDLSCPQIVGRFLFDKDRAVLYELAKSPNLWERRVAIISTFYFIKNADFKDTLSIAKILLCDKHDLINKAVGWMLREVGKRDIETERLFLGDCYKDMPRVTLRYAIEKMEENERRSFLKK